MSPRRRFRALALALTVAVAAPTAALAQTTARDHTGVWWNAAESGWGVFTIDFGNVIAPTWYTYDENGEAVWFLVAGALPQQDGSYAGDVYRFTGVPFEQIVGNAANPGTKIGSASFRFTGEDALALTYTIGTATQSKQLTRFDFGADDVVCTSSDGGSRAGATNYSDLWWNPVQNGWGVTLTHVADNIYLTWYTYGADGKPVWLIGALARQPDGRFSGALLRGTEGTPFLQIDGSPPSAGPELVGQAVLDFSDGETGEFTYTVGTVTQTTPIERFVVGSNPPLCETVTAPPPTSKVACLPEIGAGDFWRDRVRKLGSSGNYAFIGGSDREVVGTAEFEDVSALVIERRPSTLQNVLEAREYVVENAGTRYALGEQRYDVNNGTLETTAVNTPAFALPRSFEPGETVTIAYEVDTATSHTEVVRTYTLVAADDITVPAGTFEDVCKMQTTYHGSATGGGSSLTEAVVSTEWWSPEFGVLQADDVVTSTLQVGSGAPTTTTVTYRRDLVRATIDGVTRPNN